MLKTVAYSPSAIRTRILSGMDRGAEAEGFGVEPAVGNGVVGAAGVAFAIGGLGAGPAPGDAGAFSGGVWAGGSGGGGAGAAGGGGGATLGKGGSSARIVLWSTGLGRMRGLFSRM